MTVTILHPGRMGAAVGRELAGRGVRVLWCPAGRSAGTAGRATAAGLEPVGDLRRVAEISRTIISLCPPAAAQDLAAEVAATGFTGVFVEANAISPARMRRIAAFFPAGPPAAGPGAPAAPASGARVVDGGVIGPPPPAAQGTRLYLSGAEHDVAGVAELFAGTGVEAVPIDGGVGAASALKMAYGSYTKSAAALAAVSHALAQAHGVSEHLVAEARRSTRTVLPELRAVSGLAARAWRWAPEMSEVADALADAGLPGDLARAAHAVMRHWDADKDDFDIEPAAALARLRDPAPGSP